MPLRIAIIYAEAGGYKGIERQSTVKDLDGGGSRFR